MICEHIHRNLSVFGPLDLGAHLLQHLDHDHRVDLVVLGKQDASAAEHIRGLLRERTRRLCRRFHRLFSNRQMQIHREIRASARLALHHDLAAHQLDKLVGNGHAETGAAVFPRGLHGLLLERTENAADKRRLHTDAGIVYADHHIRHAVPQHHLPEGDNNFTLARKFDRIGQKIDDNLADAQLIAKDAIHGHTVKADLVAYAAAVKVFRKHIVQPITTSGKCSPSISSQSVICIPSPAEFHFYSFLYFKSS